MGRKAVTPTVVRTTSARIRAIRALRWRRSCRKSASDALSLLTTEEAMNAGRARARGPSERIRGVHPVAIPRVFAGGVAGGDGVEVVRAADQPVLRREIG